MFAAQKTLQSVIRTLLFLIPIFLLISGFAVDNRGKQAHDMAIGTLFLVATGSLFFYWRKAKEALANLKSYPILLIFISSWAITSLNLSYPRTLDIGDLRQFLRNIYVIFIITSFVILYLKKWSPARIAFTGYLVFSAFPFFSLSMAGHVLLTLTALGLFLHKLTTRTRTWKSIHMAVFALMAINGISFYFNYFNYDGASDMTRILGGSFFLLFTMYMVEDEGFESVTGSLAIVASAVFLFFVYGIIATARINPEYTPILSKETFLAGINTNDMAGYLLLPSGFFLARSISSKTYREQFLKLIPVGILILLTIASWSRAAFPLVLILPLPFVYFFFFSDQLEPARRKRMILSLVVASSVFFLVALFVGLTMSSRLEEILSTRSLDIRRVYWDFALGGILERPLLGWGPGNNEILISLPPSALGSYENYSILASYRELGGLSHSHNIFLQMGLETGLLSIPFFLFILIGAIYRGVARSRSGLDNDENLIRFGLTVGIILFILHGLFNYTIFHPAIFTTYSALIGILWAKSGSSDSMEGEPDPVRERPTDGRWGMVGLASLVLMFLMYHSVALYYQSNFFKKTLPILYLSGFQSFLIFPSDQPLPLDIELKHRYTGFPLDDIQSSLDNMIQLYPDSARLHTLAAELNLVQFLIPGKPESLEKAKEEFQKCTQTPGYIAYCYKRLAELEPDDESGIEKARHYNYQSWRYDQYNLLNRKNLKIQ